MREKIKTKMNAVDSGTATKRHKPSKDKKHQIRHPDDETDLSMTILTEPKEL